MVQQWEGSVRLLKQKDEDINTVAEEIRNLKSVAKDRLRDLEEQKTFFENEQKNNKEMEKDIDDLNVEITENKENIKLLEQIIAEENDKVK